MNSKVSVSSRTYSSSRSSRKGNGSYKARELHIRRGDRNNGNYGNDRLVQENGKDQGSQGIRMQNLEEDNSRDIEVQGGENNCTARTENAEKVLGSDVSDMNQGKLPYDSRGGPRQNDISYEKRNQGPGSRGVSTGSSSINSRRIPTLIQTTDREGYPQRDSQQISRSRAGTEQGLDFQYKEDSDEMKKYKLEQLQRVEAFARNNLFVEVKFITSPSQLFARGQNTISMYVMDGLQVAHEKRTGWWNECAKSVKDALRQKRANVSSDMRNIFMSKSHPQIGIVFIVGALLPFYCKKLLF